MLERQISIDDLMAKTGLPRYAIVKAVGIRAYTIAYERASQENVIGTSELRYIKPVEQAIRELYLGDIEVELIE